MKGRSINKSTLKIISNILWITPFIYLCGMILFSNLNRFLRPALKIEMHGFFDLISLPIFLLLSEFVIVIALAYYSNEPKTNLSSVIARTAGIAQDEAVQI